MTIIGGTVRYEDGVRPVVSDQYAPSRKFAVELQFEGDVAIQAANQAIALVNERLGITAPTRAAKLSANAEDGTRLEAANKETAAKLNEALAEIDAQKAKPKAPGRPKGSAPPDKTDAYEKRIKIVAQTGVEADEIPLGNAPSQAPATVVTSRPATVATTAEDDLPPLGAAVATSPAQPNASFSLDDLSAEPEVREISVQEMNNAAAKKMQGSKDPELSKKILGLIRSFNPDPTKSFQAKDIPQGHRQTFLDKLETL